MSRVVVNHGVPRIDATVIGLLIAGISVGTLILGLDLPLWLWPVMAWLGAWRWRLARQQRDPPPVRIRTGIGLALAAALVVTGNVGLGLEAAIPLFIGFLWLKLLELRNNGDLLMTAALGSFLAGAGVLLDQSLDQVGLALVSMLILWTAVIAAYRPPGHHGVRRAAGQALRLGLQALPIAAVLFLLLPRPAVRLNLPQGQARTGLSDHLRPGMVANLAKDQSVAFRVTFPDGQKPTLTNLYWRGLVLAETDGHGWYREARSRRWVGYSPPPRQVVAGEDPSILQEITLLPHGNHWLYAIDPPSAVFEGAAIIGRGTELVRPQAINGPVTYRVLSQPGREPIDGGDSTLARAQQVPDVVDSRVMALASTWRRTTLQRGDSVDTMTAVAQEWFAAQGFTYSLEPGVMEGDPVATFLFERRSGFCSHYATAFALLARLQGYPARIILGFRGGEWNELGDFLVVRNAHAHAWCEIHDARTGSWRRFDPTVSLTEDRIERISRDGGTAEDEDNDGSLFAQSSRHLRQWWDWADAGWQRWMFRYDAGLQLDLGRNLGVGTSGRLGLLGAAIVGVIFAFIALALLFRYRPPPVDPATRLYRRWCARFAGAGLIRDPAETARTFAARASAAVPTQAAEIAAVTAAFEQARYQRQDPQALERLRAAIRGTHAAQSPGQTTGPR